jgi:hypothetical protein
MLMSYVLGILDFHRQSLVTEEENRQGLGKLLKQAIGSLSLAAFFLSTYVHSQAMMVMVSIIIHFWRGVQLRCLHSPIKHAKSYAIQMQYQTSKLQKAH